MKQITAEIPAAKRPFIEVNGGLIGSPETLQSALIKHPALGLTIEIGAHPSNKFAALGIQMNRIDWYTLYFTLSQDVLLVGMMESRRSVEAAPFQTLIKTNLETAEYALEEVDFKIKANGQNQKELGLKVRKFDLPQNPINLNPELFMTDEKSGVRFRCIRVFNLPMKMKTVNAGSPEFSGQVELTEKIADKVAGKQESYLTGLNFLNAKQAKSIGDGIAKIGIGLLEDYLAELK